MIGVVLIGRNEGERLKRALRAAKGQAERIVYVDSGSTDGSQEFARQIGADVVDLDTTVPFTAARARNAGFEALIAAAPQTEFVQFIDGDCELQPGWIAQAHKTLLDRPKAAAVCGRRRERAPQDSVYNRLIDREWDTPVGEAKACGGDALMRAEALREVGGFNPAMIAGEEPELCQRLRRAGWSIWRIDAEMTLHDAELYRFSQWWRRNRRAGHAFAEGAAMHGRGPDRHNVRSLRSIALWGGVLPLVALLASVLFWPWGLVLWAIWPVQVLRMARRDGDWARAFFLVLGKFPEALGALDYWRNRLRGRKLGLIEYK